MGLEDYIHVSAKSSDLGFLLQQWNIVGPTELTKTEVQDGQAIGSTWLY